MPSASAAAGSIDFLATLTFSKVWHNLTDPIFRPRDGSVNEIHGRIQNVAQLEQLGLAEA